jgi:hypothetical protein
MTTSSSRSCDVFGRLTIGVAAALLLWPRLAAAQVAAVQPPVQTALAHHQVGTTSAEAQHAFDEGLTLVYAFNRDEAAKRFAKAAQLDPKLAMAWWGVALANGPNLNFGMSPARVGAANDALAKAKALEAGASPEERRYIDALAARYPPKFVAPGEARNGYLAYRDAMAKLHADYPDDLDAATLYAESAMDVEEWGWHDGQPTGSAALVAPILESVLKRDPGHVGANHYYVHVMDFAGVAERALPSAERLSALPIEPAASHLVHMSGHNYLDLGLFIPLERDNRTAIDDDRTYAASIGKTPWQLDYFGHNLDFYLGGSLMLDDGPDIDRAVGFSKTSGGARGVLAYARERRWDDVLAWPAPVSTAIFDGFLWHYARGLAFAARHDAASAHAELAVLDEATSTATGYLRNVVGSLDLLLGGRVARLDGDNATAVARFRSVIAQNAALPPEVFAPWYFPAGEWLGGTLLASGDLSGAEAAFRADLKRTPHNARALFGLMQTLSRQGRTEEARALALEIAQNWRGPLSDLRLDD